MSAAVATGDWYQANQRYLMAALARVGELLEEHAARASPATGADRPAVAAEPPPWDLPAPPALDALCRTFGLALSAFPEAHWSALTPTSPLRRWRLLEIHDGQTLATSPLRIDERVLHYLAGVSYLDERLQGLVEPVPVPGQLPGSQREAAERFAAVVMAADGAARVPAIQLCGNEAGGRRAVAAWACARIGLSLHAVRNADIPASVVDREALARLWDREAALGDAALLVEVAEEEVPDGLRPVLPFVQSLHGVVAVGVRDPLHTGARTMARIEVPRLARDEQLGIWRRALGPVAARFDGAVGAVVAQFDLGVQGIEAAGAQVRGPLAAADGPPDAPVPDGAALLWDACRVQARPRLDDLAQRIQPDAAWDDLVVPAPQRETLRQIAAHVRHRTQVYEDWGFARKSARGLGISALFAGASGTGKTMAAEVLASELRLDLYRIDLSQVVSKYIGETEKNLRRVFDAAEEGGSVLLFDEADALFGKRGEVRDSHDRYANIEVSYLLQRMESYRGLAVLTTNAKSALDAAFLRRIRFAVNFPFPDAEQRVEIWRRVFPEDTPTDGLDEQRLARLNVTGGNIRSIALGAAFMAADEGAPVRMSHLLRAARAEYAKIEKPLTDAEAGGWT